MRILLLHQSSYKKLISDFFNFLKSHFFLYLNDFHTDTVADKFLFQDATVCFGCFCFFKQSLSVVAFEK